MSSERPRHETSARRGRGWQARGRPSRTQALRFLSALALCAGAGASPAGAATLFLDPPLTYVDYPEEFVITLEIGGADSLRGFEVALSFDTTYVELASVRRGGLFADYAPPYGLYWAVDQDPGSLTVECLIIPADECVAGPGGLVSLTFAAKDTSGETALRIDSGQVRDCEGLPVGLEGIYGATIVVGPQATLFFDPDPKIVGGADWTCRISSVVDDLDSLHAFRVHLSYDPTKIAFDSATVGDLLLTDPPTPYWWYVKEESESLVRVEASLLGHGTYVDGPGELIKLHFRTLVEFDTTEVVYAWWGIWDPDIVPVYPIAIDNGLIVMDTALQTVEDEVIAGSAARPHLVLRRRGPNPAARHEFALRWTGSAAGDEPAGPWQAAVCDVAGREVWRGEPAGAESGAVLWEGRDAAGTRVAPGIYWLQVARGAVGARAKMVLIR